MSRSDSHEYEKTMYEFIRKLDLTKEKNWLGHRLNTIISKIDEMVLKGSTISEMAKKSRTSKEVVSVHLTHLRKEHGIPFKSESGKIMVDFDELKKRMRKPKSKLMASL